MTGEDNFFLLQEILFIREKVATFLGKDALFKIVMKLWTNFLQFDSQRRSSEKETLFSEDTKKAPFADKKGEGIKDIRWNGERRISLRHSILTDNILTDDIILGDILQEESKTDIFLYKNFFRVYVLVIT